MVPEGWLREPLCDVADVRTGIAKGKKDLKNPVSVPYLRVANVQDGHLDLTVIKNICVEPYQVERYRLKEGDVLMTEGGDFDKLGRGDVWKGQIDPCLHQNHVFCVRANQKIILPYFLSSLSGSSYGKFYFLSCAKKSTNLASINSTQLKEFPVLIPPISEQRKIISILSTWDKAIETVKKLIENSKAQKKALMQQLLTGKRRLPGFDEEWKTIRLDDVLDGKKRKGKIVPTNDEKRGVAYIGSTSFNGDFGIYTDSSDAVICSLKDILVLWDGENAGKATTGLSGAVSSTVVRCRIDESKANSRFITYNLLKDNYKVRAIREGSGIPHMPGDFEHWYHINLPPLKEQQEIAAILTSADKEIETLQQKLDYLKQEKKSLMQQILTGKRRVIIN